MFFRSFHRLDVSTGATNGLVRRAGWWGALILLATSGGCQTTAPIHLWRPARIASIGDQPLVLLDIAGPQETADLLREELLAQTSGPNRPKKASKHSPTEATGSITVLLPEHLEREPAIRLVSGFEDTPSDLAVAAAARRSGVAYMLRGEIMHATGHPQSDERLNVVWRLVGLDESSTTQGMPVSVGQETIAQRHPDLLQHPDPQSRLRQAMVRETLGLLGESVVRRQVTLSHPRYRLGSGAVRRGNALAQNGDWPGAEQVWQETLRRYPGQVSAWINASIAAAARQDFIEAKRRASQAVRLSVFAPTQRRLAEETLVWLELQQRDYHRAFDLPDPSEGWRVTHDSPSSDQNPTRSLPGHR